MFPLITEGLLQIDIDSTRSYYWAVISGGLCKIWAENCIIMYRGKSMATDFVTLTCPNCGGKLQVTPDLDRFACGYCGQEHIVKRGGGVVALAPVVEKLTGIKTGVDRTAAELAVARLKTEIAELKTELDRHTEPTAPLVLVFIGTLIGTFICATSSSNNLVLAIVPAVACVASFWYLVWTGNQNTKRQKPYRDLLMQKQAELQHHQKLLG